ncbi:MFS transporter [Streptomyces sp. A7024]|uniref:MFS transporter n=1 Tax=Streptomyces coryli TaxID=1128680 RepID=A0A6G4U665_9ACTN|nr:MFS transporter [Streptomyces coryli]NGN67230.1 MFS transporter [Streptomyces coryli]
MAATDTYRRVIALTGPALPVLSFLGRLPVAMIQFGSVLLVAETSGSLGTAGLVGGALAVGQVACGPLVARLADRRGQRPVVLCFALLNAVAVAALVAASMADLRSIVLTLLGAAAGATVPAIGPLARSRLVTLARQRDGADEQVIGAAMSLEGTLDETAFVLGPALVGLAAVVAHPAAALALAAVLVAACGSAFALHPTAELARKAAPAASSAPKRAPAPPRAVYLLCASLALQGAMFGAAQAGIAALTEELGQPEQAGLVYAAMGVMSAVVGLGMAAVPARYGLQLRRRVATGAGLLLSLPLLWAHSLWALYAIVVVLGITIAPHLISVFGLTERAVPPVRLGQAMAFATSALVGGQALSVAVSGRLAEAYGPAAAFGLGVVAMGLCFVLALGRAAGAGTKREVTRSARSSRAYAPPG